MGRRWQNFVELLEDFASWPGSILYNLPPPPPVPEQLYEPFSQRNERIKRLLEDNLKAQAAIDAEHKRVVAEAALLNPITHDYQEQYAEAERANNPPMTASEILINRAAFYKKLDDLCASSNS